MSIGVERLRFFELFFELFFSSSLILVGSFVVEISFAVQVYKLSSSQIEIAWFFPLWAVGFVGLGFQWCALTCSGRRQRPSIRLRYHLIKRSRTLRCLRSEYGKETGRD